MPDVENSNLVLEDFVVDLVGIADERQLSDARLVSFWRK